MKTKIFSFITYLWRNPIIGYLTVLFAEWFYFFCRKACCAKKIPSITIPMDANGDGHCDHCGQTYTVGMDKEQTKSEHIETSDDANEVIVETKPKARKRAVRKIEKVEEPQVAKPKRTRKTTTKKTTTKKKTTKSE